MNILLIHPCFKYSFERYRDGTIKAMPTPPLGMLYIAAELINNGHSVKTIDMTLNDLRPHDLLEIITTWRPGLIGISAGMAFNIFPSIEIANIIKSKFPDLTIIFGGIHSTFTFEDILSSTDSVDAVVLYEGENVVKNIVDAIESRANFSSIAGIAWTNEDHKIIVNEIPPKIKDLDELPIPYRDDLPMHSYPLTTRGILMTSRGCPFSCSFCSTSAFNGNTVRFHSVDRIIEEIKILKRSFGINHIVFGDDTFTVNRKRVELICDEILKNDLNITWGCDTRADMISPELLKIMSKSGCSLVFFGVENIKQESLTMIDKGLSIDQIRQAISWTKDAGIQVTESFIVGLPGQTIGDIEHISKFIRDTQPDEVLFNMMIVYPGTKIYKNPDKFGIKWASRDWSLSEQITPMVETDWMSSEEMKKSYIKLMLNLERDFPSKKISLF